MGLQPNQTGPLNIAGGLEGEGNDLGFHHTSLETETHDRRTDGLTDKSWGREPTALSPLCTHSESQTLAMQTPAHPPTHSSVCGDLPPTPCNGWPQGDFLWLFLYFGLLLANSTPSSFPQPPAQSLSIFYTYSDLLFLALCFLVSLPQGFLGKQHLGHLLPSEGPLGRPCLPSMRDSHSCSTLFEVRG